MIRRVFVATALTLMLVVGAGLTSLATADAAPCGANCHNPPPTGSGMQAQRIARFEQRITHLIARYQQQQQHHHR